MSAWVAGARPRTLGAGIVPVLVGTAARFAAERLESPSELAELVAVTEQLDQVVAERGPALERYVELNDEYHAMLVTLAKSDADYEAAGVQELAISFGGPDPQATLRRYAAEIMCTSPAPSHPPAGIAARS